MVIVRRQEARITVLLSSGLRAERELAIGVLRIEGKDDLEVKAVSRLCTAVEFIQQIRHVPVEDVLYLDETGGREAMCDLAASNCVKIFIPSAEHIGLDGGEAVVEVAFNVRPALLIDSVDYVGGVEVKLVRSYS